MDAQLRALAGPRRRQILELVRDRELAAGEIASHFDVTRPAVSQHLAVLKDAGLVAERREGTRRLYRADAAGLAGLKQFVDRFWATGLDRLKDEAEAEWARRAEA
jgi:DNA-binding transcriptional ArsR family regulator